MARKDTSATKTHRGTFSPKNPQKYVGGNGKAITYRSSWELSMMRKLDEHPNVLGWASECISIPYINPLTGLKRSYVPDFLIIYEDRHGNRRAEIIEIKPLKESPLFEGRVSRETKLIQAINAAKWQAAVAYCRKMGLVFRVATEADLFGGKRR